MAKTLSILFLKLSLLFIRTYQLFLSGLGNSKCRYLPSCSEYSKEALQIHGFWLGWRLSIKRILRCHPWGGHGLDPVPPYSNEKNKPCI